MDISRVKLHIYIVLTAMIISLSAVSLVFAEDQASAKVQALRQTGKQLLDVGYEQYRRGMYDSAKTTLDKAAVYKNYLSVSDASKLEELLVKLNSQPSSLIPEKDTEVKPVVEQPAAVQQTQTVIVSEPVQIQVPQPEQVQQPATDNQYIEFIPIDSGDIQQTEQSTSQMIPAGVESELVSPLPESDIEADVSEYALPQSEPLNPAVPAIEAEKAKENYIEVVKQKQRIQQSYTKAIVNEAVARAGEYAAKEEFIKAKDEISRAGGVVERNKLLLGDEDYAQYTATLNQILQEVNARQTEVGSQKAEKARAQAQASQENLRAQQTADRQKRIENLMTHSAEYQEQQRYPEALAQLETLLAIDPTNREAARNKQMLEDIINLRRQVDLRKEMGREEQDVFYEAQKSMIPHADLMNYPRNWQDIAAKRKPTTITGLSAADAAVYKQLELLVDLSVLTPDTPMEEAIEIIRTSVDPALKLVVRWKDLADNAYIERDTIIGMQGLNGIPLGKGIKELLDSVAGGIAGIDYSVDDGIITIATRESLPNKLVTHVYDITELIGTPANYRADLATEQDVSSGQQTTTVDPTQLQTIRTQNAATIMQMIQDTIAPITWLINGGEGTISSHGNRLVISQTPQVHEQIQKLLMEDLRESLGHQVSIETRFLFVTENFLEDIGLDMQVDLPLGVGKFSSMRFNQGSYDYTVPSGTLVPGSLGTASIAANPAISLDSGVQYGSMLDDLSLTFFLRATQAHRDAKMLTAPRVTVLSGESAYIRVAKEVAYVSDYQFEDITSSGVDQPTRVIANPTTDTVTGGVVLNVTPTISADMKYVILEISANYTKTDFRDFPVYSSTTGDPAQIQLPTLEVSEVQTRVSVPDGGTLLIGGQKLGAEVNKEAGVPGLSKMPVFGRLFSNRSKVKDQDILLVLVKPSIILQEEAEREYFAPLE
ncbi:MAG: hypothetical protein PHP01_06485 [Phycisphaerae bacterium]|nr:hypothetical protein [Phycisphaerae bacterium]